MSFNAAAALTISLAIVAATATAARAHDFWLQPSAFGFSSDARVFVNFLVGHGTARHPWPLSADRIAAFEVLGPEGRRDASARARQVPDGRSAKIAVDLRGAGSQYRRL